MAFDGIPPFVSGRPSAPQCKIASRGSDADATLIPVVLTVGAFAVGLALLAWVNSRGPTGGADASDVARRAVQALVDGDRREYNRLIIPDASVRDAWPYPSFLRGCQIAGAKTTAGGVAVVFQTPCGSGTRTIACVGVQTRLVDGRYYVSSFIGC